MDLRSPQSPLYTRQWVASNGEYSVSPAASPVHPYAAKRSKNVAARNLAQVMAINAASVDDDSGDDDDDDDDGGFRFAVPAASRAPPRNFPAKSARRNRSPSPAIVRGFLDNDAAISVRSTSSGRTSAADHEILTAPAQRKSSLRTPSVIFPVELPVREARSRPRQRTNRIEQVNLTGQQDQLDAFALYDHVCGALITLPSFSSNLLFFVFLYHSL
ncbi:hypothetical protein V2J09_011908 [Rumex salicifolius]